MGTVPGTFFQHLPLPSISLLQQYHLGLVFASVFEQNGQVDKFNSLITDCEIFDFVNGSFTLAAPLVQNRFYVHTRANFDSPVRIPHEEHILTEVSTFQQADRNSLPRPQLHLLVLISLFLIVCGGEPIPTDKG